MSGKREKKEEEDGGNQFNNLDKTSVLQEARYFNETPVNHRKCSHILTKILYLLNQGEKLSTQEATDVFFATTKLFQSKDTALRRLVYLCIKELSGLADDVIIVTSSLTKDMTGKEDLYRAAAIRALCSITDSSMLQAIERYMKQAIVDKNPAVSSAALVSTLHLSANAPDLARRWANEAQEATTSDNAMVSYHALGVVAAARRSDRHATAKLVIRLASARLKSPYALCLLIRMAARLIDEDNIAQNNPYMEFIESCLRNKSEMVIYEAAHAIVNLRKTPQTLAPAVSVLQLFCGSSKATLRLAGARTLARLTARQPAAVAACAVDLENLISDSNRSVATLAVTTLLATGAESSVDRLMKQIATFVSEISDEFKIIVVKAIRRLCSKFPRKHQALAAFLAGMLRDEGGLEYKAAIADAIIALVEENPDAKESGLAHLCEFIEDCEHTVLAVRILHLLGREGPKARHPSRYIRFVYNRVILESGPVRAAAVSAVAQFGAARPELLPNVRVLLARCQMDDDDEVRDRALYYGAILDTGDQELIHDYIVDIPRPSAVLLEKALRDHLATRPTQPFDILAIPTIEEPKEKKDIAAEVEARQLPKHTREERSVEILTAVPGIERLGPIFKSCEPIELTEAETEYRVKCTKHVFANHVVLQFECVNTLSDQLLERVRVRLEPPAGYQVLSEVPCDSLPYEREGSAFYVLRFPECLSDSLGAFSATLEFAVRDCDPTTGEPEPGDGYADSYPLEDFEIGCTEQIRMRVITEDWDAVWQRTENEDVQEACETFALPQQRLDEAASAVCKHLGLRPPAVGSSDVIVESRGVGMSRLGTPVLIRARIAQNAPPCTTMQLALRSPSEDLIQLLLSSVG